MKKFFPTQYVKSVHHIDYENLKDQGIKGLIFDIDNTLVPYFIQEGDEKLINLLDDLKKNLGFKITLVSNGKKNRVVRFNRNLKLYAIHKAGKPRTANLKKAMTVMKTDKQSTVIIGDQIFTDVWAANRLGIASILVEPVSEKDEFITWIKRGMERMILKKYMKNKPK